MSSCYCLIFFYSIIVTLLRVIYNLVLRTPHFWHIL